MRVYFRDTWPNVLLVMSINRSDFGASQPSVEFLEKANHVRQ